MPIIFKSKHICDKCGKEFEWVNFEFVRSKLSSGYFKVEKIPNEPKPYLIERLEQNNYKVYINCPFCGYYNIFIYVDDSKSEC